MIVKKIVPSYFLMFMLFFPELPLHSVGTTIGAVAFAANVSEVPFWDGETVDPPDLLLNRLGGRIISGKNASVQHVTDVVFSGKGAFRINTNGAIGPSDLDFIAIALTGFGHSDDYIDTRDISNFKEVRFWLQNDTGSPFTLIFEIKDYRDSDQNKIQRSYNISTDSEWQMISVPIDGPLNARGGWTKIGNLDIDLTRAKLFALAIKADAESTISGSIHIDEMFLIEKGGDLDSETANIDTLVDRLAERQFRSLWGSRDRVTGLVPSISAFADVSALNTTAALVKLLPKAVQLSWVTQTEADTLTDSIVNTLDIVMNNVIATGNGGALPPRYIDRVRMTPNFVLEESSVDAAFMYLALYQYKALSTTPESLIDKIEQLLQRFNFKAFSAPGGWSLAYKYDTKSPELPGFTAGTYDGYSGEVWIISLAAHLQTNSNHHVDIATQYHSAVNRVRTHLVDPSRKHLVHSATEFRAPFLQWLFSLFIDVTDRSIDTYPDRDLASNPYDNALFYQLEVHAKKAEISRELFLQPDAGDDGTGNVYEQFSCYNNFGQADLFMPWSVGFSFLADPEVASAALRHHLSNNLHGPLGLTDSVRWTTGNIEPSSYPARHDFWNISLSAMALMQYRFGGNELLASLPEVKSALDVVLPVKSNKIFSEGFEGR